MPGRPSDTCQNLMSLALVCCIPSVAAPSGAEVVATELNTCLKRQP